MNMVFDMVFDYNVALYTGLGGVGLSVLLWWCFWLVFNERTMSKNKQNTE